MAQVRIFGTRHARRERFTILRIGPFDFVWHGSSLERDARMFAHTERMLDNQRMDK
jgi:hypothetical protein